MVTVGIWERNRELSTLVEAELKRAGRPACLRPACHPAELAGEFLDLLAVSPEAVGWAGAPVVSCRAVLLPGAAGARSRPPKAESAVSYGTSPRDTLTLSSTEEERLCVEVQRELVTVSGAVVERQELVLPCQEGMPPTLLLAAAGTLLLLDLAPDETGAWSLNAR